VGGNYTQTGGTLQLGVGGVRGRQYDHVQAGGAATIVNGKLITPPTLTVDPLGNFAAQNGNAFAVVRSNGQLSGRCRTLTHFLNPNLLLRLSLDLGNAVVLVYLRRGGGGGGGGGGIAGGGGGGSGIDVGDPNEMLPSVDPDEPISESEVVQLVDPTAEELTSL